jgi:acetyl-CoA carboxylase carboxyl transferase subunit beta
VLKFTGAASYEAKLAAYRKKMSMLKDAVVTGVGMMGTHRVALGVMDFQFLGGSMGSVVGEKLTRLIETATDRGIPLIIVSTSGGARMYEGMFSLMQMAKTCGALAYHAQQKLPYISVLTDPTTAGVMASYASVGDLVIAEPGATIGFAGRRVVEATTQSELPPDFQTAEFLMKHGMIDAIVSRLEMKSRLSSYLDFMMAGRRAA